jgi:hypothetical protein
MAYLKTSYTYKYWLKLGKCFECFTLDMKVYARVQWSRGIIVAKGHEFDTWHVNKDANKKWHEATLGLRGSEVITITCYTHHTWHE